MRVHNVEQRSPEWHALRNGIPTASNANMILTPTGRLSAQADKLIHQLIAQKLGVYTEKEPTEHMLEGIAREPEARATYELDHDVDVSPVGFITSEIGSGVAGCSPDGLIEDTIGWEVKNPLPTTQIAYLLDGGLPAFYKPQIHFSLAVTGFSEWRFMSYVPELDPLYVTVYRDEYTEKVRKAIEEFMPKLNESMARFGL